MSLAKGKKINRLLASWPSGTAMTSSWLYSQGYGYDLLRKYRKSGWVQSIGQGAIAKAGDNIHWTGGLYAIQNQLQLPIYPGGKTALDFHGHRHFVPLGKGRIVTLCGPKGVKLPSWFLAHKWDVTLRYTTATPFPNDPDIAMTEIHLGSYPLILPTPERAAFEMLHLVPGKETFVETALIIDGLRTLRPQIVQELLEKCCSKKVIRLFLFHAERTNHQWFEKLNLTSIDLGTAKYALVEKGVYDPKYRITVPREFASKPNEQDMP